MLFSVLFAAGQEPYVFYTGSVHQAHVAEHAGTGYEWKVYVVSDWTDPPDQTEADVSAYTFISGINNSDTVSIQWNTAGRYYLIVEESFPGSCSTRRALQIEVQENEENIGFIALTSSDCYDGDNTFSTEIGIYQDALQTTPLPEEFYPITLSYRVNDGTTDTEYTNITLTYADVGNNGLYLLPISGILEDDQETRVFTITLFDVEDRYNTPINITSGYGSHTRTIYHLPQTGTMDQDN